MPVSILGRCSRENANILADVPLPDELPGKFAKYAPHFTGPISASDSVKAQWQVIQSKSVENGDSGDFFSHMGNKQWI